MTFLKKTIKYLIIISVLMNTQINAGMDSANVSRVDSSVLGDRVHCKTYNRSFFSFPKKLFDVFLNNLRFYPAQLNLSYWWSLGSLAGICLMIQIISGLFLAMHYIPHPDFAFESVEHIMRNVPYGWLIRYVHSNGASLMFIVLYLHIAKALFLKSYVGRTYWVWFSGVIIFILTMATAFLGYVLPWGQMSYWGATVITNFTSTIPIIGNKAVLWLWGSHSVGEATLKRFYVLHFALPFIIVGLVCLHLVLLHESGSTDFLRVRKREYITFYPYFYIKDLHAVVCLISVLSYLVLFEPNLLSHPDNYIKANPLVTPEHIVPEWYFLPYYAILRSVPNKELGVTLMLASILILFILPVFEKLPTNLEKELHSSSHFSSFISGLHIFRTGALIGVFVELGWLGGKDIKEPFLTTGLLYTILYFGLIMLGPLVVNIVDTVSVIISKSYFNYLALKLVWKNELTIWFNSRYFYYLIIFIEVFNLIFSFFYSFFYFIFIKYDLNLKIFYLFSFFVTFFYKSYVYIKPFLDMLLENFVYYFFEVPFFVFKNSLLNFNSISVFLEKFVYYFFDRPYSKLLNSVYTHLYFRPVLYSVLELFKSFFIFLKKIFKEANKNN